MKQCSVCKEFKALDQFYRVSNSSRHRAACKQCTNMSHKIYVKTEIGATKKKAASKTYRQNNRTKRTLSEEQKVARQCKEIERKYGITCQQRDDLLVQQNGNCAKCEKPLAKPVIDHDHTTGKVRGILCYGCNVGIGLLGDSIEGLEEAVDYLRRSNANHSHH